MPDPLLNTKLIIPPMHSGFIFRPRLVDHLKAAVNRGVRLVLISAPAGAGKSTLASEWAMSSHTNSDTHSKVPAPHFAWLSLDSIDNDPLRFWSHLIGALQVSLPDFGQSEQRMLSFSEAPPLESILTRMINQIGSRSEKIILILDDYHLITEQSIHEGITFILEHLPANMHLVLSTRSDPPLPLNRLCIQHQLLEIRSAELSFTLTEFNELINDVMGLELNPGDLASLDERTEGWAAGVQLAAILLLDERRKAETGQDGPRLSALVARLSGRHHLIAEYLIDEVLNRQSDEVQRFLLRTSVLDEMCAPLCDALFAGGKNKPSSQLILDYLDHANLFLIPLDEEHAWFRYHHLFADALQLRLERTQPGATNNLHQRASHWYEQNGNEEKSIRHALAAQDYDLAARLIELFADTFNRQGRFVTLNHWLEEIPKDTILTHPYLIILSSRMLALSGKLSAAEQQLQTVESASDADSAPFTPELRGKIAAVRSTIAILNTNIIAAKEQSQLALSLLPPADPSRAVVLLSYGDATLMSGEIAAGIQLLREAIVECRQHNDLSSLLTASAHLAEGLLKQGNLNGVESVCLDTLDEVNSQLGSNDWPLPSLALIYTLLGGVKREWNDFTGAEHALNQAVEIAKKSSYISALVNAYTGLAALRRSQGNIAEAIELVERGIQNIHKRESTLFLSVCQAQLADYWAQAGNYLAARKWVEDRKLSADRAIDYLGDFELYALVRLWTVDGQADEADALASRLIDYADANGWVSRKMDFLVLQALARQNAGRQVLALQSLEQALEIGEAEKFTRTFLDEGQPLFDLFLQISRKKTRASAYAHLLLSTTKVDPTQDQIRTQSSQQNKPLVEPLTQREVVVLRQMASGCSNQEIAQRLVISVGTVKAHIYHITAKLGARSRTEAVARAREAGLLP
ncbi:MAG: LuxR C-terminal-related transcriptional regulator [Anaerolineaceae bacterium]